MADIEHRLDQLKNLRYPNIERGDKNMTGAFRRVGITVTEKKVTVSLEAGPFSYRGTGNTVDTAIMDVLKKVNTKMDAHM